VIALVADDLLETVAVWPHGLDLFGRFNQRSMLVTVIGVLHGDTNDRAGLEIDRMLGFVSQMRPPIFHLRDLHVGSCGWAQSSFNPFFFRYRSTRARSARVGVSIPDAGARIVKKS